MVARVTGTHGRFAQSAASPSKSSSSTPSSTGSLGSTTVGFSKLSSIWVLSVVAEEIYPLVKTPTRSQTKGTEIGIQALGLVELLEAHYGCAHKSYNTMGRKRRTDVR